LERGILTELHAIVEVLRSAGHVHLLPINSLDISSVSLLIVGTAHEKQRRHNQIISQNDRLLTVRDYTNSREQQDAFELLKEVGFVLCDEEWRSLVFFAARVFLGRLENKLIEVELKLRQGRRSVELNVETVHYITRFLPEYSVSVLRSGLPAKN